jgi:hypothetical protein
MQAWQIRPNLQDVFTFVALRQKGNFSSRIAPALLEESSLVVR